MRIVKFRRNKRYETKDIGGIVIKIEENTIIFKSTPEDFEKEKSGTKSCTIRRISLWSELKDFEGFYNRFYRFNILNPIYPISCKIQIVNTETRESFERTLTDISQFEGLWVFSWRAE